MENVEEIKKYVLENGITTIVYLAERFGIRSDIIAKKLKTVKLGKLRFVVENIERVNMEDPKIKTIACVLEVINERIMEARSRFIEVRPGSVAHKRCGKGSNEVTDVALAVREILNINYGIIESTKRNHLKLYTSVKIRDVQTLIIEAIKMKLNRSRAPQISAG